MIKYTLTIIKHEDNENYEAQLAAYKEQERDRSPYGYNDNKNFINRPEIQITTRALEVVLNEEEFKKVKAESIKAFE